MGIKAWARSQPRGVRTPLRWAYRALPARWRYSRGLWRTLAFLQTAQWASRPELERYQLEQLRELVAECRARSPFYQRHWPPAVAGGAGSLTLDDLRGLPFTSKDDLLAHGDAFISTAARRRRLVTARTGGTTGAPAVLFDTAEAVDIEHAYTILFWSWHGVDYFRDRMAFFRGTFEEVTTPTHDRNLHRLPTWHLTPERIAGYLDYLRRERIVALHGYPSLIYELFRTAHRLGRDLPALRQVFFASERPYDYQREFITENFPVKVAAHYGHREHGALFLECPAGGGYHVISHYGITEFERLADHDLWEIVTTGFINRTMPLVRYRTRDYALLQSDLPCSCGRHYPKIVADVVGRTGDLIDTPSGRVVAPNHLAYALRYVQHVRECQIIQEARDRLVVLVQPDAGYGPADAEEFQRALAWRIGEPMEIRITEVEAIARPQSMKKRFTVNRLREGGASGTALPGGNGGARPDTGAERGGPA